MSHIGVPVLIFIEEDKTVLNNYENRNLRILPYFLRPIIVVLCVGLRLT